MTEVEFGRQFVDFLITEKGYTRRCLLLEAPLADKTESSKRYIADLLILDTDFNSYLALVEFKGGRFKNPIKDFVNQVKSYLNVIDQANLPAYLVVPDINSISETDFVIYILDNNDWRKIEKNDFPHYETLSSKNQADEKKDFKDYNDIKVKELKKKKELFRATAFSTLASLAFAAASMLFISKYIFFDNKTHKEEITTVYFDSIQTEQQKIKFKLETIEKSLFDFKMQDSITNLNNEKVEYSKLNRRVKSIENTLNVSPERLLKIQEITFQVQTLKTAIDSEKELNDAKINGFKERIDQLTIWTSGLIITIIGSIIGFAINAFRKS